MYGGAEQRHFNVPYLLFRDLVYTPNAHMVDVNIEGNTFRCILQDMQFHPVNDSILHADFLELDEAKPLRMDIPVKLNGTAVGVTKGGKISMILPKLKVVALPKDMPDFVDIDVSDLDLGKSVKVSAVQATGYKILNTPATPIASIVVPRALRGKAAE
jgi:large subunit ribosomal protein L25